MALKRKRELRIKKELRRHGSDIAGHGWAARRAAKRANRGRRISKRTLRKRGRI